MNSLNKIPVYGNKMVERIRKTKSGIKQLFIPGMLFEEMGIIYLGPVDGSDMKGILRLLKEASNIEGTGHGTCFNTQRCKDICLPSAIRQDSMVRSRLTLRPGLPSKPRVRKPATRMFFQR